MKKIISMIALLCITIVSMSAANTSSEAKKILDKAAAKVSIKTGAQMNFSISGNKIANQSGVITIKGNKFCAKAANATIWFDGKTQWTYVKKNEEVNVSTPSASQQAAMNPYTFINLYKSGYTLSVDKSASGNQVHLVANGKKSIQEMYILVDGNNNIKQVKMKQSGGWITINISNIKSVSASDAMFKFNAKDFPKAEVIDLR